MCLWRTEQVDEVGVFDKLFPGVYPALRYKTDVFHDLSHFCASLLLDNGVSLKQIQEWLGHSDFSITANIYATPITVRNFSRRRRWRTEFFCRNQEISRVNERKSSLNDKSCSFQIFGKNSQNEGDFGGGYKKEIRQPAWLLDFSMAEWVGFEPTVPWGTTDFESVPLWPLRYHSVYIHPQISKASLRFKIALERNGGKNNKIFSF